MFIFYKPQSCNSAKYNPKLLKMLKLTIYCLEKDMIIQAILKAFIFDTASVLVSDNELHAKDKLFKQTSHDNLYYLIVFCRNEMLSTIIAIA